ncbi:hypothetical protein VTN96DRAFT_7527 [Rasamsonia emersonii]
MANGVNATEIPGKNPCKLSRAARSVCLSLAPLLSVQNILGHTCSLYRVGTLVDTAEDLGSELATALHSAHHQGIPADGMLHGQTMRQGCGLLLSGWRISRAACSVIILCRTTGMPGAGEQRMMCECWDGVWRAHGPLLSSKNMTPRSESSCKLVTCAAEENGCCHMI